MSTHYQGPNLDPELACVLERAFGYVPRMDLIALPREAYARRRAFALNDPDLPRAIVLFRYLREEMQGALRAFQVLQALQEVVFQAAPQVFYMGWGQFNDELFLLLEYPLGGRSTEGHPTAFFARTGKDFAATLARLHQIPWHVMPELPRRSVRDVLRELGARLQALNVPPLRELFQRLWEWAPEIWEQPYSVIHGRYALESIVSLQTRVMAIYDWEQAALADTRLDFGYACARLSMYNRQMVEQFSTIYTQEAGLVHEMRFWNALGGLCVLVELTETLGELTGPQHSALRGELSVHWRNVYDFTIEQVNQALP